MQTRHHAIKPIAFHHLHAFMAIMDTAAMAEDLTATMHTTESGLMDATFVMVRNVMDLGEQLSAAPVMAVVVIQVLEGHGKGHTGGVKENANGGEGQCIHEDEC